jgi:hypothetical protein
MVQAISNKKPNAPTSLAYTANSATISQVVISFTAPTNVTIVSYTASTGPSTGTPAAYTVSGLTSNTLYNLTLVANGIFKSSVASSPALSILTKPGAPTIGTATVSETTASIPFTAPSGNGTITSYTATSNPGGLTGTGTSPVSVTGLTAGTAYTFTVTATNASGTSISSSASNGVTPVTAVTQYNMTGNFDSYGTGLSTSYYWECKTIGKSYSFTFNPTKAGTLSVFIVAGGGLGAWPDANNCLSGGGGAGGYISTSYSLTIQSYIIMCTVGNGGTMVSTNGDNSTFKLASNAQLIAIGGGWGGNGGPFDGGSGSGGTYGQTNGGAGTPGQGNNGGWGDQNGGAGCGGGGGAGGVGINGGIVKGNGGNGGIGMTPTAIGIGSGTGDPLYNKWFCGGGGGDGDNGKVAGNGGKGGGGGGAIAGGSGTLGLGDSNGLNPSSSGGALITYNGTVQSGGGGGNAGVNTGGGGGGAVTINPRGYTYINRNPGMGGSGYIIMSFR